MDPRSCASGETPGSPELYGGRRDRKELDSEPRPRQWRFLQFRALRVARVSGLVIALGCYLALGSLVYSRAESHDDGSPWTLVDALYFTSATMSTVGYGDLSPGSGETRTFTLFMILSGIIVIFPVLASAIITVTGPITLAGRTLLEYLFPQHHIDIDGDSSSDYTVPRHALIYYPKNMVPSFLLTVVVQLCSSGIYSALEGWSFYDSFYHSMVTATTVGYGDMTIVTQEGRLWASIHMITSVAMLGELISTLDTLREERAAQLACAKQLSRRLEADLINQLLVHTEEFRVSRFGLTEVEFAMAMLIELEIVSMEQVRPFLKQFRALDVDNSGCLEMQDLKVLHASRMKEFSKLLPNISKPVSGNLPLLGQLTTANSHKVAPERGVQDIGSCPVVEFQTEAPSTGTPLAAPQDAQDLVNRSPAIDVSTD